MFVYFKGRISLSGRTFLYVRFRLRQCELIIIILWCDALLVTWGFSVIFLNIWSEPSINDVNIIRRNDLRATLHNICPIWGYCAFTHVRNCGKLIIKNHMKLR